MQSYLIHYGEIGLKGRNRDRFENQLIRNIQFACRGLGVERVRRLYGRLRLDLREGSREPELEARLTRVFGISHVEPVQVFGWDLDGVREALEVSAREGGFESFAIRARRVQKEFPTTSMEMNRELGALVQSVSGARVDLTRPERTYHVVVLNKEIFVFHRRFEGPCGLPVGAGGRVGVLLSGGIDSPVAAVRMLRRGCVPVFIHFHSSPFTDRSSVDKTEELARIICRHRLDTDFFAVPLGILQQSIVAEARSKFRVLLYRRYMLRLAERIAREQECVALVTGESIGQVSSQTLHNLAMLDQTVDMPVLRPLLTYDKDEIVQEAREYGTFEVSTEPHSDCCSYLLPRSPATKSKLAEIERIEAELSLDEKLEEVLERTEHVEIFAREGGPAEVVAEVAD